MILTPITAFAHGLAGDDFANSFNTQQSNHYTNYNNIRSALELTIFKLLGRGILAGSYTPPLATNSGFDLLVASHISIIDIAVVLTGATSKTIPPSSVYYVWEFQDNSDAVPHYELTLLDTDDPSIAGNPAHLLFKVTTDGAGITLIENKFSEIGIVGGGGIAPTLYYETFELNWDADPDRTGGTIYGGTLSNVPSSIHMVFRAGIKRPNTAITLAGADFSFITKERPLSYDDGGITVHELVEIYYY